MKNNLLTLATIITLGFSLTVQLLKRQTQKL
jgi:hypothetical protein